MALDPLAERGFGRRADHYERARPGWPAAALDAVLGGLGLSRESTVVDLGAGTGKLTRQIAARGLAVTAVDPSEGMLEQLRTVLPGVPTLTGTADSLLGLACQLVGFVLGLIGETHRQPPWIACA